MTKEEFMVATLRELGEKTEIPKSHWARYFAGNRSPSLVTLERHAEKLDIPLEHLVLWFRERRDRTIKRKQERHRINPQDQIAQAG
jgi:transcriptional regulator with XRE-family HTH domain